jgi:hypothetical protein
MLALLGVAAGVAMVTWLAGWWGVIVAAFVAGVVLHARRGAAWLVALACVVAWGAIIVASSVGGRFAALASAVGGTMGVPAAALVIVTLLFGALLGWSAALLGGELASAIRSPRGEP